MHRSVALLLIPSLIATSGVASLAHTHTYRDHDHPEHHHGLAVHEHDHGTVADDDTAALTWESCDPGQHAVPVLLGWASLPNLDVMKSLSGQTQASDPLVPQCAITDRRDVRVHGPPSHRHVPSRAPPLPVHA